MTVWYRYEIYSTGIILIEYPVEKETPKGVRLSCGRFVLKNARKRFALPTIQEAQESFIARKQRQIRILKSQLYDAEKALATALAGPLPKRVSFEAELLDFTFPETHQ